MEFAIEFSVHSDAPDGATDTIILFFDNKDNVNFDNSRYQINIKVNAEGKKLHFLGFVAQKEVKFGNPANKAKLRIAASSSENVVSAELMGMWEHRKCMESNEKPPEITQEKTLSKITLTFPEIIHFRRSNSKQEQDKPLSADNSNLLEGDEIKMKLESQSRGKLGGVSLCEDKETGSDALQETFYDLELAALVPIAGNSPAIWDNVNKAWGNINTATVGSFSSEDPENSSWNRHRTIKGPSFDGTFLFKAYPFNQESEPGAPSRKISDHLEDADTKWYMPVRFKIWPLASLIKGYAVYGASPESDFGPIPPDEDNVERLVYKLVKIDGPKSYDKGFKKLEYFNGSLGYKVTSSPNPNGHNLEDKHGLIESFRFSQMPQVITSGESFIISLDKKVQNLYLPDYFKWKPDGNNVCSDVNLSGQLIYVTAECEHPSQNINSADLKIEFVSIPSVKPESTDPEYLANAITSQGRLFIKGDSVRSHFEITALKRSKFTLRGHGIELHYELDKDGTLVAVAGIPYKHTAMTDQLTEETGSDEEVAVAEGEDDLLDDQEGFGTGQGEEPEVTPTGEKDKPLTSATGTDGISKPVIRPAIPTPPIPGIERTRPVTVDTANPAASDAATHIRDWMANARPPLNAVPGADVRYSPKGNEVGTVPGGTIRSAHEKGANLDPNYLWTNKRTLDSVDHCSMEEYVVAKLKNESISHCVGRYGGVKDLTGERLPSAKNAVENAGLKPSISIGSPAKSPEGEGTIEKQKPDWKEPLKKGETVTLVVYSPYVPPGSVLPDFTGKSVKDANKWLKDNDFEVKLKPGSMAPSQEFSNAVAAQEPVAGTALIKGAKVVLTVHAPFVDVRKVPNVVGFSAREAKEQLTARGFNIKPLPGSAATSKEKSNTVESQNPSPQTKIEAGSIVEVRIHSEYIDTRKVPNVVGLSAREGQEKIAAAGFVMKPKPGKPAPTKSDQGRVWRQSPKPGTQSGSGSEVAIYIYGPVEEGSSGQKFKTILVPNVRGLTAAQAKQRIANAGLKPVFKPGKVSKRKKQEKTVERQKPTAGSNTGPGSEVVVFIYRPYAGKTPPSGKVPTIAKPKGKAIEDLIIGSEWVKRWPYLSDSQTLKGQAPGRMKFFKDENKIIAVITEVDGEARSHKVGEKYYELIRKVDPITFIAKAFRKYPTFTDELVFLCFPTDRGYLGLVEVRLKELSESDWDSTDMHLLNKYNRAFWSNAEKIGR